MKKFTAFHIADVRLRRADQQEQALLLHSLFQDVAALRDAGKQVDAIFFTGQLLAADADKSITASYVYESFLRPLLQAASPPGARFYLLPGSRAQDTAAGFSFFSADAHAGAERRALYKNLHAVFHGRRHTGAASSLMTALGILFKSNPGSLYSPHGQMAAYAVLEFDVGSAAGEAPLTPWTVALREFDEASKAFALSVLYTPDGREAGQCDADYVFASLLPQLAGERDYFDGLMGKRSEVSVAADARAFLVELAFVLCASKTLFLLQAELECFAGHYCAVKGWDVSAEQWLAPLYARGLLARTDGQVVFAFDYFRTYFLAQRFEPAFDLRRYAPERHGRSAVCAVGGASAARPLLRRRRANGMQSILPWMPE